MLPDILNKDEKFKSIMLHFYNQISLFLAMLILVAVSH